MGLESTIYGSNSVGQKWSMYSKRISEMILNTQHNAVVKVGITVDYYVIR